MSASAKLVEIDAELKAFQAAAQPTSTVEQRSAVAVRITQTLPLVGRIVRMVAVCECEFIHRGKDDYPCYSRERAEYRGAWCWPCRVRRELGGGR